jgi:hypothetical protein
MIFHKNSSSGSQVDMCGQLDRSTDIAMLTGTFQDLYEHT